MNKTSIIILSYNNLKYTKDCIESIRKYTEKDSYEIIVVDNASSDDTVKWLCSQKDLKVIYNTENVGFPRGCNQGIELAHKDNDILLLNNDTIVTTNWLYNLKTCLYSSLDIGAVGPVCNNNENNQGENIEFKDFDHMQEICKSFNVSNSNLWEEKVFLIGFCLLIKREAFNKIKKLDENYTPGYIEDNDLSLELIKNGYKLMLCHDTYIYHYLGSAFRKDLNKFYPILFKNRKYFKKKWGFETVVFDDIKTGSIPLIFSPKEILDIDGGIGVNGLSLRYRFNCKIDILESDYNKRLICNKIFKTYKNLEEINKKYDYILIGKKLEYVKNPVLYLNKLKKKLKMCGYIVGEFNNVASIKEIINLLNNSWYYHHKDKCHLYTLNDIDSILKECKLKDLKIYSWYINMSDTEKNIYDTLSNIKKMNYEYTYFSFRVSK